MAAVLVIADAAFLALSARDRATKRVSALTILFKMAGNRGGRATRANENARKQDLDHSPFAAHFVFISSAEAYARATRVPPGFISDPPWNPFPDAILVTARSEGDSRKLSLALGHRLPAGVSRVIARG